MLEMLYGMRENLQLLTAILTCFLSMRFALTPILVFVLVSQLPQCFFPGSALLPQPMDLIVLPLASGIACTFFFDDGRRLRLESIYVVRLLGFLFLYILASHLFVWRWEQYRQIIGLSLALVCAATIRKPKTFWFCIVLMAFYSACVTSAFFMFARQVSSSDLYGQSVAVANVVGDRNYKSFLISIGVVIGYLFASSSVYKSEDKSWISFLVRLMGLIGVGFCGYGLLQTQSRGGVIVAGLSILGVALHQTRNSLIMSLIPIVLLALLINFTPSVVVDGLVSRFESSDVQGVSGRSGIWRDVISMYSRGSGVDMLLGKGAQSVEVDLSVSTHNSYLRILVDQGVLGLVAFITLLGVVLIRAWKRKDSIGTVQFGLIVLVIGSGISLEPHYYLASWWLVLGLCAVGVKNEVFCNTQGRWA
jgi:O-antigen ligase